MRKALPSLLFPAVVVLLTFAAFLPVLGNEFLAWDDRFYITDNVKFRGKPGTFEMDVHDPTRRP